MHNEGGAAASPAENAAGRSLAVISGDQSNSHACGQSPSVSIRHTETNVCEYLRAAWQKGQTPAIRKQAGHAAVPNANGEMVSQPMDSETPGMPGRLRMA